MHARQKNDLDAWGKIRVALEDFLEPRLEAARRGEWSEQTVDEIVAETLQEEQHS